MPDANSLTRPVDGWAWAAADLHDSLVKELMAQSQRLGFQLALTDKEIALENEGKKRPEILAALDKQRKRGR